MTTWVSKPAGPPSAPERAASAVSSIQMTASTADTNAGLAQAAAGSAQSAANDAAATAGLANSAAILAVAKFEALPEANIVINNVDHEAEDWGATVAAAASGTTWFAPNGVGPQVPGPMTWTQPVPAGSKMLLVFVANAYKGALGVHKLHFNDPSFADSPAYAATSGAGYFSPNGSGAYWIWAIPISSSFTASTVDITWEWSSSPSQTGGFTLVDASSLVVGGSASGAYDIIADVSGVKSVPADSLLVQLSPHFQAATAVSVDSLWPGFSSERVVQNLVSQQSGQTYGLSSRIASRNIDAATSVTISNSDVDALIIIKSADRPAEDRVGSFAKMVTNSTATAPSNTVSNKILPLNNYYQAETHSPDLAVDLTTASFQIFYTGTYLVEFTVGCDANTGYLPVVLVNGTPESYGGNGAPSGTFPSGLPILSFSTLVYLNKGDYVSFGIWANSGTPALSRAASVPKHAAISLVNRSYL